MFVLLVLVFVFCVCLFVSPIVFVFVLSVFVFFLLGDEGDPIGIAGEFLSLLQLRIMIAMVIARAAGMDDHAWL